MSLMLKNDCGSGSLSVDGFQTEGMTYTVYAIPMDFWMCCHWNPRTWLVLHMYHILMRFSGGSFVPPDPEHSEFYGDHTGALLLSYAYILIYSLNARGAWYSLRTLNPAMLQ